MHVAPTLVYARVKVACVLLIYDDKRSLIATGHLRGRRIILVGLPITRSPLRFCVYRVAQEE